MRCAFCDYEPLTEVLGLGHACFMCMRSTHNGAVFAKLIREPEISWWVMEDASRWYRASIDQQEALEQAFKLWVKLIIESED